MKHKGLVFFGLYAYGLIVGQFSAFYKVGTVGHLILGAAAAIIIVACMIITEER